LRRYEKMKPKQLLRFVLILFILGTVITLCVGIFNSTDESTTPPIYTNPLFDPMFFTYSSRTNYGIPAPWLSYTYNYTYFNPYHRGLGFVKYNVISEYTFLWFGFIEDVLLYSLISFLLLVYLDWRKKREYPNDPKYSNKLDFNG